MSVLETSARFTCTAMDTAEYAYDISITGDLFSDTILQLHRYPQLGLLKKIMIVCDAIFKSRFAQMARFNEASNKLFFSLEVLQISLRSIERWCKKGFTCNREDKRDLMDLVLGIIIYLSKNKLIILEKAEQKPLYLQMFQLLIAMSHISRVQLKTVYAPIKYLEIELQKKCDEQAYGVRRLKCLFEMQNASAEPENTAELDTQIEKLSQRISYDHLLVLDHIPEELAKDPKLQYRCAITGRQMRYPALVEINGREQLFFCEYSVLKEHLNSSAKIPGLNCLSSEVISKKLDKLLLRDIENRLEEIRSKLAQLQHVNLDNAKNNESNSGWLGIVDKWMIRCFSRGASFCEQLQQKTEDVARIALNSENVFAKYSSLLVFGTCRISYAFSKGSLTVVASTYSNLHKYLKSDSGMLTRFLHHPLLNKKN